jgi:hypothetical protein
MRLSHQGDTLWLKSYGINAQHYDVSHAIVGTADSGYVLVGSSRLIDSTNAAADVRMIKIDVNGNLLWFRNYGIAGSTWENAYDVVETSDGGFAICGYRDPPGSNNRRLLLIRTDSAGNQLWEKTYGGPYNDWGGYVCRSKEGGFVISGAKVKNSTITRAAGWLLKMNDTGSVQWSKEFMNHSLKHESHMVRQLKDGSYVAIGIVEDDSTGTDRGWIYKVDELGNLIWSRTYTRNTDQHNYFWDFDTTSDGGFVVCGTTHNATQDAWLLKLDSIGCNAPGCDTITGVIEVPLPATHLEAYPNPTSGLVTLRLPDGVMRGSCTVQVVDVMGRIGASPGSLSTPIGRQARREEEQFSVDLSGFVAGIYIIRVESEGQVWQAKVVKR